MKAQELQEKILQTAESFGFKKKTDDTSDGNAILRSDFKDKEGAYYFGFIRPEEQMRGPYSDFSFIIFPGNNANNVTGCLVSFCIGSAGFSNDYDLASRPGIRRLFLDLLSSDGTSFCKVSFTDNETESEDLKTFISQKHTELIPATKKYSSNLPVARYVDLTDSDKGFVILNGWLALYAKIRNWATNNKS